MTGYLLLFILVALDNQILSSCHDYNIKKDFITCSSNKGCGSEGSKETFVNPVGMKSDGEEERNNQDNKDYPLFNLRYSVLTKPDTSNPYQLFSVQSQLDVKLLKPSPCEVTSRISDEKDNNVQTSITTPRTVQDVTIPQYILDSIFENHKEDKPIGVDVRAYDNDWVYE